MKFWFRRVANAGQTQTFCVSIWLIAPPGHLKGIPHIKFSNKGYHIGVGQNVVFSASWVDFSQPGPITLNENSNGQIQVVKFKWPNSSGKFWFRRVANDGQTWTFCVSIWLIAPSGHLKGIPHIKFSNRSYHIGVGQNVVFSASWVDFGQPGPIPLNETRKLWNFVSEGWLMMCKEKRFAFPYDS